MSFFSAVEAAQLPNGTFASGREVFDAGRFHPTDFHVGQFSAGDAQDLAVVVAESDEVLVLDGDSLAAGPATATTTFKVGRIPESIVSGNNAGLFLATANSTGKSVSIARAPFSVSQEFSVATAGEVPQVVVVDETDQASDPDSIYTLTNQRILVLETDDGTNWSSRALVNRLENGAVDLVVGDVNEDSIPDLFVAHTITAGSSSELGTAFVAVYVSHANGYLPPQKLPVANLAGAVALSHLNDDDWLDLVVTGVNAPGSDAALPVTFFYGAGGGSFDREFVGGADFGVASLLAREVHVENLFGDATPELVVARGNSRGISVLSAAGGQYHTILNPQTQTQDKLDFVFDGREVTDFINFDEDNVASALSDGIMLIRTLAGFSGSAIVDSAFQTSPQRPVTEQDGVAVQEWIAQQNYDLDGDGNTNALTDGILFLRYLANFSGESLTAGALGRSATRTSATQIIEWIEQRVQPPTQQGAVAGSAVIKSSFISPEAHESRDELTQGIGSTYRISGAGNSLVTVGFGPTAAQSEFPDLFSPAPTLLNSPRLMIQEKDSASFDGAHAAATSADNFEHTFGPFDQHDLDWYFIDSAANPGRNAHSLGLSFGGKRFSRRNVLRQW